MNTPTYTVAWSAEDDEYVATASGYPSLSYLHPDPVGALRGLRRVMLEDLL